LINLNSFPTLDIINTPRLSLTLTDKAGLLT